MSLQSALVVFLMSGIVLSFNKQRGTNQKQSKLFVAAETRPCNFPYIPYCLLELLDYKPYCCITRPLYSIGLFT